MKEPVRRAYNDDLRMTPIVFGVLGFLLVLGIAGQLLGKYVAHERPAAPVAKAPAKPAGEAVAAAPAAAPEPAPAPSAPAAAPAPAPAAEPAPAPAPAASSSGMTKLALAGGTELEASGDGVESKILAFINDANAAIDNKLWFDFDRLNFETGSAKLTADSKAQVDNIAAILRAYPNVKIKIGGYTDNTGKPEMNLDLSNRRAKAVVDALTGLGIAGERLSSEGYGDQHPIADNATAEGRAKNRRISVSVRAK